MACRAPAYTGCNLARARHARLHRAGVVVCLQDIRMGNVMSTADDNLRIMLCPTCGSEGRILTARGNDPYPTDHGECPECEGGGLVLVEVEPIDMQDLEAAAT